MPACPRRSSRRATTTACLATGTLLGLLGSLGSPAPSAAAGPAAAAAAISAVANPVAGPVAGAPTAWAPPAGASSRSPRPAPRRLVSAWLPHWRTTSALASVRANADLYADASPFWFQLTEAGAVVPLSRSVRPARIAATVAQLHRLGIPVYPTVVERLDAAEMAAFLGSPARRAEHRRDLVALAVRLGVDGVDLDYEAMTFGGGAATRALVRERFARFAAELAPALRARGKRLVITVPARTRDADPNWAVYDYRRLGAAADRLRVMTYDYGWRGSVPRAVAPLWWVDRVLRYAVTRVPPRKLWMGVPTYGWAWPAAGPGLPPRGRARALTHAQALSWQRQGGVRASWQQVVGRGDRRPVRAPYFTVVRAGQPWTVYYNDAASVAALTSLVARYRLGGAAFWSVGAEDPAIWPAVRAQARRRSVR